jgi:hypothetical protein
MYILDKFIKKIPIRYDLSWTFFLFFFACNN